MRFRVKKIDAAVEQLDWAITLFLDHKAYISSITLAGAAEEIIGKTLGPESTLQLLKDSLSAEFGLSSSVVSKYHLNKAKNWLKHGEETKDKDSVEIELETEAIQCIVRAITNLAVHDKSCTNETPLFLEWIRNNRKDLLNDL